VYKQENKNEQMSTEDDEIIIDTKNQTALSEELTNEERSENNTDNEN
jgi:hypothetical protein